MKHLINRLREEKSPIKFLISRVLWKSGWCRIFKIRRRGYSLKFLPTALSANLWVYPNEFTNDENLLRRYLRPGDTFVDVGANIGMLTLAASTLVGNGGHVFCYEAHPQTFKYLVENIEINKFDNITPRNIAASNASGHLGFSDLNSDDQNYVSLSENLPLTVPAAPLDEAPELLRRKIALLKIDVEGFEKYVLEGARCVLERTDAVYFEVSDSLYGRNGYGFEQVYDLLAGAGFDLFQYDGGLARAVSRSESFGSSRNVLAIKPDSRTRLGFTAG